MNYQEWYELIGKSCNKRGIVDQGSAKCKHPYFSGAFVWCDWMNCPELIGK